MLNKKLLSSLGMESIQFQSGVFFKELAIIFGELMKEGSANKIKESDQRIVLEKCIAHHTGLNVKVDIGDDSFGPAVNIPRVDKNHPFIVEWNRGFIDDGDVFRQMKEAGGIVRGSVNLLTGKATGIFSEIESIIHYPVKFIMDSKYSAEEHAAITLHEIGHLFTYYEFITRTVTTNQVLAGLSRGLTKSDTVPEKAAVIISAQKALRLKEEGVEELAKSNNSEIVNVVILSQLVEKSRSEFGNNIYDINSWEYLADEFAARHQAGKHLITAFDKIYRQSFNKAFRSTGMFIGYEALKLVLLVGGIFTGIIAIPIMMISMDCDSDIYDQPEARMRRVRQQIVENLKDKRLSPDDAKRLNEDIATIDMVMKNVEDRRQFFGVVYDWLSPRGRKNRREETLQKELETIANNDLFVKAAQFKELVV